MLRITTTHCCHIIYHWAELSPQRAKLSHNGAKLSGPNSHLGRAVKDSYVHVCKLTWSKTKLKEWRIIQSQSAIIWCMWNDLCIYIILFLQNINMALKDSTSRHCYALQCSSGDYQLIKWRDAPVVWCALDKTWSSFMHMHTNIWVGYDCHITCMYYYPLKQTLVSVLGTGIFILAFIRLSSCFTLFYIIESSLLIYCHLCFIWLSFELVLYYYKTTILL